MPIIGKQDQDFHINFHQVFIEPKVGYPGSLPEWVSTSLPADVQMEVVRSIPGWNM